jgi:hypothetical protein
MTAGSSTEICGEPETSHSTFHELRNWGEILARMLTGIFQNLSSDTLNSVAP